MILSGLAQTNFDVYPKDKLSRYYRDFRQDVKILELQYKRFLRLARVKDFHPRELARLMPL
jgi:hypothetical protein